MRRVRRNVDERLRRLERAAAQGDPEARRALEREQARAGQRPYERIYVADLIVRDLLEPEGMEGHSVGRVHVAEAVRAVLKAHKIKAGVNTGEDSIRIMFQASPRVAEIFGLESDPRQTYIDLYPSHREERSRQLEDYYWPAGPTLSYDDAQVFMAALRKALPKHAEVPPYGFQTGQVVKFLGRRPKRYMVEVVRQQRESDPRRYDIRALSGRKQSAGSMPEDSLELDKDQGALGYMAGPPVAWNQVVLSLLPDGLVLVHAHQRRTTEVENAFIRALGSSATRNDLHFFGGRYEHPKLVLPPGLGMDWAASVLHAAGFNPVEAPPGIDPWPGARWLANPDPHMRRLERAAKSGDRDAKEALFTARLRAGQPQDFSDQAHYFLTHMELEGEFEWVPYHVVNLDSDNFMSFEGTEGLTGRYLVIQSDLDMNDLWADTANTEQEVAEIIVRGQHEDETPWFPALVVDLLHMEPAQFRYGAGFRRQGGPEGTYWSSWHGLPPGAPGS